MPGNHPQDADRQIPYCEAMGMKNLAGAYAQGVTVQACTYTHPGGAAAFDFTTNGLSDMYDTSYQVFTQNNTSAARLAVVSSKAATGFTITNPNASDSVDILIVGRVKGQVA